MPAEAEVTHSLGPPPHFQSLLQRSRAPRTQPLLGRPLFHRCIQGFSRGSPEEHRLMTEESEFLSNSFPLGVGGGG